MTYHAEVHEDVVEICDDDDTVVISFPTNGRTVEEVERELRLRYGALAPNDVTDRREDGPPRQGTLEEPLYPDVTVQLVGEDGNAGAIMGRVTIALKRHGVGKDEIDRFRLQCMSGDYNHLLHTVQCWVEVE